MDNYRRGRNYMKSFYLLLSVTVAAVVVADCSIDEGNPPTLLNINLEWFCNNHEALNDMVLEYGNRGKKYSVHAPPVAVFDFDSTWIKNDIGDIATFWVLNNNLICHPPGKDWSNVSPLLTQEALNALNVACSNLGEPGSLIVTDQTDDASMTRPPHLVPTIMLVQQAGLVKKEGQ